MRYIKLHEEGNFSELSEEEFMTLPGSNAATLANYKRLTITIKNPDISKEVDPYTPNLSVHRILQVAFPTLSYLSSMKIASLLVDDREEIAIL
jgi:urate oxidase